MTNQPGLQQEFLELMNSHRGIIYKVTNLWCRNRADRDELAQDILVELWRAFPTWDPKRKFSTWFYRVALNVAISDLRKRRLRKTNSIDDRVDELVAPPGNNPALREQIEELYRFIDEQDPINRGLILLYLEEYSYREMAEIIGITETNVATKISRLKARMKCKLNPQLQAVECNNGT